jgi:hypothetical protein
LFKAIGDDGGDMLVAKLLDGGHADLP